MEQQELDKIVNEVHAYLVPIRAQCDLFCTRVEEYTAMLEEYTTAALQRHRAEFERRHRERERLKVELLPGESFIPASDGSRFIQPTPQDEELESGPPQEGWVWTQYCDYAYTGLGQMDIFWRPAEPAHPVGWLCLPRSDTSLSAARTHREWTDEERLRCECFRLASVHDLRLLTTRSPHEPVFLSKPYSGRFQRDEVARALGDDMRRSPRSLEDLQISWSWARAKLDEHEQERSDDFEAGNMKPDPIAAANAIITGLESLRRRPPGHMELKQDEQHGMYNTMIGGTAVRFFGRDDLLWDMQSREPAGRVLQLRDIEEATAGIERLLQYLRRQGFKEAGESVQKAWDDIREGGVTALYSETRPGRNPLVRLQQTLEVAIGDMSRAQTTKRPGDAMLDGRSGVWSPAGSEMDETEIRQVKEYATRVAGLLEPMAFPSLKLTGESEPPGVNHANRMAQRMASEQAKALQPLKVEYRKKVIVVLEDDWEPIADIFERYIPQTLQRLDGWRQEILDHTDPAREYVYWLESRDGKFGPNRDLKKLISKLEGKLRREVERAEAALSQVKDALKAEGTSRENDAVEVDHQVRQPSLSEASDVVIPTTEEIAEVIKKLEDLEEKIGKLRSAAENGEEPERARAEAQKAEGFFKELHDTLATDRPFGPIRVAPSMQASIDAVRDSGEFPGWSEAHSAVMQRIEQSYKDLPICLLRKLRTEVIPTIWKQDSQTVTAGMTVGDLKDSVALVEKAKELELTKRVQAETVRAAKEVNLTLCPYRQFLQREFGDEPIQLADASSLGALIYSYRMVERHLEVRARHTAAGQHREKQTQTKRRTKKVHTETAATQTIGKFQRWKAPRRTFFVIDDNRVKLYHDDIEKELKLKSGTTAHRLLYLFLAQEDLPQAEIKKEFCTSGTTPWDVVRNVNRALNKKIAVMGFADIPLSVEWICFEEASRCYRCCLRVISSEDLKDLTE